MTLPSGPPMSTFQIANELGISMWGFSISSPAARALAGVPSGPIRMKDFYGKSATMTANIGVPQSGGGTSTSNTFSLTCTPTGGTAPYTYAWQYGSQGGVGTVTIGSPTSASTGITLDTTGGIGSAISCNVECTVTDATSRVVPSNTVSLSWTFT